MKKIAIVGGGLAGTELAYQLSKLDIKTTIYEAKLEENPSNIDLPHKTKNLAELVCSNSFRGQQLLSAAGLLKAELKELDSLIMKFAEQNSIPAGSSLTVDRNKFSQDITEYIKKNKNINLIAKHIKDPENLLEQHDIVVLAVGPSLTHGIKPWFQKSFGENLYFYDAIAPILDVSTVDMDICFWGARNSDEKSYLNAPFTKDEYYEFVETLKNGEMVKLHKGDDGLFFMGCMPAEELAKSGPNTLRFSPMRGDGLLNPHTNSTPYAAIQLRPEGINSDAYGMVGFQTRLKYGEQERIFRKIPGFKNVEFIKHGSMHRNTYINAPKELNKDMSLKNNPNIYLAGQISGVEGYIESTAHGIIVANEIIKKLNKTQTTEISHTIPITETDNNKANYKIKNNIIHKTENIADNNAEHKTKLPLNFPDYTALGSLIKYLQTERKNFQPSKINFGLFESLDELSKKNIRQGMKKKLAYREAMSKRALRFYI